jgi:hypothetical protein
MLQSSCRFLTVAKFRRFVLLATPLLLMQMFTACSVSAATDGAEATPSPMTLEQVVNNLIAKNEERARNLKGYEGTRTYTVRYHGFPKNLEAQIIVSVKYEAPDTKEFTVVSQRGPKLLVDRVLKRLLKTENEAQRQDMREEVDLNRKNYEFSALKYVPAADGCRYILTVEPKKPNKFLYRGQIRVHDQDFAVCSIQAEPAQNPSFWITSTSINESYKKIGEFWLPEENKSVSRMRFGGSATLTIEYQDYKIQAQ